MAVGQRGSEHVAVLVTTALVKVVHPGDDRYSREALYEDMFAGLAALGYPHPLVVEAVHGYRGGAAPVLAAHAGRVLYTRVNNMHNQGINEFLSVHAALLAFGLALALAVIFSFSFTLPLTLAFAFYDRLSGLAILAGLQGKHVHDCLAAELVHQVQ